MDGKIFVVGSIIIVVFRWVWFYLGFYIRKFLENQEKLPPGPWGLPILGYLPFIDSNSPQLTVDKLIKTYGQTVYVNFGQVPCVILSDPKIIKSCFSNYEYSGRAPLFLTHGIMNGFGLICAQGERWKIQRNFTLKFMRKLGMSKFKQTENSKMEQKISICLNLLLEDLADLSFISSKDLDKKLSQAVGNMMNEILFGIHYSENDEKWQKIQKLREDGIKEIQVATPVNFLPWLRYLVPKYGNTLDWMIAGKLETHEEYKKVIENTSRFDEDCIAGYFYQEKAKLELENAPEAEFYSDEQLYHLIADLFGAGLDTTLTTLKWALLYFASYPELQNVVRGEFDGLNGDDINFQSTLKMPKTCAILMEIQRLCPVVPLGVPHGTFDNVELESKWNLPKGCMVMVAHWSINYNPNYFEDPYDFKPLRFYCKDENSVKRDQNLMPFQVGRRRCVGEDFGQIMVFMSVVKLIKLYKLTLTQKYDFTTEPKPGFTRTPNDFVLKLEKL